MPTKKESKATLESTDGSVVPKPLKKKAEQIKKKRKAAGPYKMPPPLSSGAILESGKSRWITGQSIGKGGFGEIYLAAQYGKSAAVKDAKYVVKVEPQDNGPLFTEQSVYVRLGKPELINSWVSSHKLSYLGIPKLVTFGFHEYKETRCRFLVLDRFGDDVDKLFCQAGKKFGIKTVCHLALRLIEALEYLHTNEYVHADIKGSNLLTGLASTDRHKVYLVDYGLASRYFADGKHREYSEDRKRCHDGTIEFTSIDAHNGVRASCRGDMEILGYCLLQWACGRLPWEDFLDNKTKVAATKKSYKENPKALMKDCFPLCGAPSCLEMYMEKVGKLAYDEKPNYSLLKRLFISELKEQGLKDDGKGLDWLGDASLSSQRKRPATHDLSDEDDSSPMKKAKPSPSGRSKKIPQHARKVKLAASPRDRKLSKSPKKSSLEEIELLVNGEESTIANPPTKPTAKRSRRSPRGKQAGKSKSAPSAQRRRVAAGCVTMPSMVDDKPDCSSLELKVPQVAYPIELGYSGQKFLEEAKSPSVSKEINLRPRKKGCNRNKDIIAID